MNERQMKAAVDGIEMAISNREVELERLKTKRDAMRWREGASVEIERLTAERNEARAEVERLTSALADAESRFANERDRAEALREKAEVLTKERDEARAESKTLRGGLHRAMRGYFNLADLVLSGEYADTARKMAEEFQAIVRPDLYDVEDMVPASHAEKVLVSVAKAAARIGAEEMRMRAGALARLSAEMESEAGNEEFAQRLRADAAAIEHLGLPGDEP